ncbi:MAG: hypothetical protein ACI4L1_00640 [Christensenellales bacterium]
MENFNQYCLCKDFITNDGVVVKELNTLINKLDKCFKKDSDNFAETCFIVYRIKKLFDDYKQVYVYNRKQETYNFDTIMTGFGISKSESSRILSCYEKFCCLSCNDLETAKCTIIEEFKGFSKSKLFELLQVDNTQIIEDLQNKVIRFDFSVKSIRDYVKNLQELKRQQAKLNQKQEDKIEEEFDEVDIPMAYNPQQHYDFEYFENKNKAQLLNIVWELQKEYEKLKTNYNKLKKEKR